MNKPILCTLQCKSLGAHTWRSIREPCAGHNHYVQSFFLSWVLKLLPTSLSLAVDLTHLPEQIVIQQSCSNLHISCLSSSHQSFLFDVSSYFLHIVSYLIASFDLFLLNLLCLDLLEYSLMLWSKTMHFSISCPFHGLWKITVRASLVVQWLRIRLRGFPGGAVVRNPPANAGDTGSCPSPGRSHMLRSG